MHEISALPEMAAQPTTTPVQVQQVLLEDTHVHSAPKSHHSQHPELRPKDEVRGAPEAGAHQ